MDDTIEARLQAKHNLRQSVHQHNDDDDDDKYEDDQDCKILLSRIAAKQNYIFLKISIS